MGITRINPDGKQAPESTTKIKGDVSSASPHFARATIFTGKPVNSPNDIGQNKKDIEEMEYEGNADSRNARGSKLSKEN